MKKSIPPQNKRDHTVIVPNFFDEGKNLEAWQLGWDLDSMREAKSSNSRDIFNFYVCELCRNMVFYYAGNGNLYGIHTEESPTPIFLIRKNPSTPIVICQFDEDTHNYEDDLVLFRVRDREQIWDMVKIDGKPLEEVLGQFCIMIS